MNIGAWYLGNRDCEFVVWAPGADRVELRILSASGRSLSMEKDPKGYWKTIAVGITPGTSYLYRLDDERERPDPASHFQPEGVHCPSMVVGHDTFPWEDTCWRGIALAETVIYEIHVGTFTSEGTFDAVIPRISQLKDFGVTALELMPVAQFPGERNWGYDGVYPFAVHNGYGGPEGLKRLINACHKEGIAVILDVVYNHLGPEGNYLSDYGPYFTDKYKTPWGPAINFDDVCSNEVRNYFIENALHWFLNYHLDALRLDAIHGITDMSAKPFLRELAERVVELSARVGRKFFLLAESNLNDPRVISPRELGGLGLDAQWCDDFHHALHTLLTGENDGYYRDFGKTGQLVKAMREGFVYSGGYSRYRERNHGDSSNRIPAEQFIVFLQNHDQVGNRMRGERLAGLLSFESLKTAAGALLLSPFIPLLFMGEEYGEDAPFLYFINHSDPDLVNAVQKGRKDEFKVFADRGEPPDPALPETFLASKITWENRESGNHRVLLALYRQLLRWRRDIPALSCLSKENLDVYGFEVDRVLFLHRWKDADQIYCIFNFSREDKEIRVSQVEGRWARMMDSADRTWNGPGTLLPAVIGGNETITMRGESFALFRGEEGI